MQHRIRTSSRISDSEDPGVKFGRAEAVLAATWLGALALAAAVSYVAQLRISITLGIAIGLGLALYGRYLRRAAHGAPFGFKNEATGRSTATWRITHQLASLLVFALAVAVAATAIAMGPWWWVGILGYVAITVVLTVVSSRSVPRIQDEG
jgi:membrane protein implicated in regulation of membrane protease activity